MGVSFCRQWTRQETCDLGSLCFIVIRNVSPSVFFLQLLPGIQYDTSTNYLDLLPMYEMSSRLFLFLSSLHTNLFSSLPELFINQNNKTEIYRNMIRLSRKLTDSFSPPGNNQLVLKRRRRISRLHDWFSWTRGKYADTQRHLLLPGDRHCPREY